MHWNRWYAIKSYIRSALWIAPVIALALEQVVIRMLVRLDAYLDWVPRISVTVSGATITLDTATTLAVSFLVFTFGSMLVAIQVASGQLTARIIATTLLRDNTIRTTVGLFVFTLLFATGTKTRIDTDVPGPLFILTFALSFLSIIAFLFLIDYTARLLRPITIVWRVGEQGLRVIEAVYPDTVEVPHVPRRPRPRLGEPDRIVPHQGTSAIVLAINVRRLVAVAQAADGVVEFVPRVGEFVPIGEPLFRLYGKAASIDDNLLRGQIAFGPERTIEQDSTFAFRVIIDIALRALSPAINDPTTAVLAIDQLHRLLRSVGRRHLHDDSVQDSNDQLRLIVPTPNWEDFVQLTFAEIRLYGAGNFQISRRLRAMIENLVTTLPEARRPALLRELGLLDRALVETHRSPEDLALARQPDLQGLGGAGSPDAA
jgi:uncharacterized membrane protein